MPERAFPVEFVDPSESKSFPIHVAGYTRGKWVMYDAERIDCSVAYDRLDPELQQSITLYLYPRSTDEAAHFAAEKERVLQVHRDAKHVSDKRMEFVKDGQTYPALVATFEYVDERWQPVTSQLVLITLPTRLVKVRSTSPRAQGELAERGMLALLDGVHWAHLK